MSSWWSAALLIHDFLADAAIIPTWEGRKHDPKSWVTSSIAPYGNGRDWANQCVGPAILTTVLRRSNPAQHLLPDPLDWL